jgi:hypothetical protein
MLLATPFAPLASIAASVVAAAVKEFVEQLREHTSEIEKKIDLIIQEPLESAVQTIIDVLSVRYDTEAESCERERQLSYAFDNLRRAYAYAAYQEASHRRLVRMYQAIVAALKEGGRPFALLCLADLRTLVVETRAEASSARTRAADIDPEFFERHRIDFVRYSVDYLHYEQNQEAVDQSIADAEEQKSQLLENSAVLEKWADHMESFCRFVEYVVNHRDEILRAA